MCSKGPVCQSGHPHCAGLASHYQISILAANYRYLSVSEVKSIISSYHGDDDDYNYLIFQLYPRI